MQIERENRYETGQRKGGDRTKERGRKERCIVKSIKKSVNNQNLCINTSKWGRVNLAIVIKSRLHFCN